MRSRLTAQPGGNLGNSLLRAMIIDPDTHSIESGEELTLDASKSSDPENDTLSFLWTQTFGASVTMNGDTSDKMSFTAPEVDSPSDFEFELTVEDGQGNISKARALITVNPSSAEKDEGGSLNFLWLVLFLLASFRLRQSVEY